MKTEIKIPEVGESVREALLAEWFKKEGDFVHRGEPLFVIETDKITVEVPAGADGILSIIVSEGERVSIGTVAGFIDTAMTAHKEAPELSKEPPSERAPREAKPSPVPRVRPAETAPPKSSDDALQYVLSPSVRRLAAQNNLDVSKISGTGPGGRLTKGDVLLHLESSPHERAPVRPSSPVSAGTDTFQQSQRSGALQPVASEEEKVARKPMSPIRRRIAERLVEAKQNTAMLTTFNEVDMSRVQALRIRFKDAFREKHAISLGIMSFFTKATVKALKEFPALNAFIVDGKEIEYHDFYHIGVAMGTERGLVVPVIRHAERLSFAELERAIQDYAGKIRENRLELSDLEGGTFTISNGGVYGSLLSTPILNLPQSGILGMHKIEDRPVVVNKEIQIRPMMYVALSYDHRIVDGREAVTFLRRIKECVEEPERILMEL